MTTLRKSTRRTFHPSAYEFVFSALRHAQDRLGRDRQNQDTGHVSGPELLESVRDLALQHFGLMAMSVFSEWGVCSTGDFGKIVFELIEAGEMRKTDEDRLEDFVGVYDFREALYDKYEIDTRRAFQRG